VGLKEMHMTGSLVAFACAPGTVADDGHEQQNGLFTKHLLKHLATPSKDISALIRFVNVDVYQESNRKQKPEFTSSSLPKEDIYLFEDALGKKKNLGSTRK
jgi:hypothetical protein